MEKRNGASESVSDDHETGTWVIALTGTGEGFIGRVQKLDGKDAYIPRLVTDRDGTNGREENMRDQVGVEEVLAAKVVTLNPVYDYRERVREIPVMGPNGKMLQDPMIPGIPAMQPMRTPLVMPVGFTMEQHPVHVPGLCFGTTFRFLSQMDKRDADTQRQFAKDTREQLKQMRMQASNLSVATPDDIARVTGSKA